MFEYRCTLSLRAEHPSADLSELPKLLGMPAMVLWQAGEKRRQPNGVALEGVHRKSYCSIPIEEPAASLSELLRTVLPDLRKKRDVFKTFTERGTSFSLFVGWFSDGSNSRDIIEWPILAELADMKFALDLDFYGSQDATQTNECEES